MAEESFEDFLHLIGKRIARQMELKDMKSPQIAERAGLVPNTVRNALAAIEKGSVPNLETVYRIGEALDLPVYEMTRPEDPLDESPKVSARAFELALIWDGLPDNSKRTIAELIKMFPKN